MTAESKKIRQSSGVMISDLPRDAIDNIFSCLSLRDAVKTSILSRKWRYLWEELPYLVFNRETFSGTTEKRQDRLLIAIHEVLLLHRGPIVKFVLSLPGLKSCPEINPFILSLSRNCGLKEFTLQILEGTEPYKLPLSLFSCVELNRLSLHKCVIEPPIRFKGFNRLVSMELSNCTIPFHILSGLISCCPLLEELKVTSSETTEGHIEISVPKLRKLSFTGDFPSICVKYSPFLSSCYMCLLGDLMPMKATSDFFKSLHNLPALEDLKLDYYYAGDKSVNNNSIPRWLTNALYQLRSLTLRKISFCLLHEISTVLCLIRSSPNLVKLVVDAYVSPGGFDDGLEHIGRLLRVQDWWKVSLKSLRVVEFKKIVGTLPELQFIELLLAISPKLETMTVTPYKDVTLMDRLEILAKVTCLPRLSPLAKILYRY